MSELGEFMAAHQRALRDGLAKVDVSPAVNAIAAMREHLQDVGRAHAEQMAGLSESIEQAFRRPE